MPDSPSPPTPPSSSPPPPYHRPAGPAVHRPPPPHKKGRFGRFSAADMSALKDYLMSLDGGRKEERVADAIVTEVAKYLYFCEEGRVNWSHLSSSASIHRSVLFQQNIKPNNYLCNKNYSYIERCRREGIKEEGQLSKLERITLGIKFAEKEGKPAIIKITNLPIPQLLGLAKSTSILTSIGEWKKTLRKKKKEHALERLEEASEKTWSMETMNSFLDNKDVWSFFDKTYKKIKKGHQVNTAGTLPLPL